MAAHLSKIHGLDWHPDNEFILATSSQDNSVRVRLTGEAYHPVKCQAFHHPESGTVYHLMKKADTECVIRNFSHKQATVSEGSLI